MMHFTVELKRCWRVEHLRGVVKKDALERARFRTARGAIRAIGRTFLTDQIVERRSCDWLAVEANVLLHEDDRKPRVVAVVKVGNA